MSFNYNNSLQPIKNVLFQALQSIDEFVNLDAKDKGKVVDANFKSMLKDLMDQLGMKPGIDYKDDLRPNEPGADFVIYTEEANNLIKDLMEGNVTIVKEHTRVYKSGKTVRIKAYFKKARQKI